MKIIKQILLVLTVITRFAGASRESEDLDAVNLKIAEVEKRLETITYLKNYATLNSVAQLSNADVEQAAAILEETKEKALAKATKNAASPQAVAKSGKGLVRDSQLKEQAKPEEKKPESLLNQLIGKSVVKVEDADFKYAVVQVRPFKSETAATVSSLTIVAETTRVLLYDSDGTELARFDQNSTAAGKPLRVLKAPAVGDMMFGVVYENAASLYRIKAEEGAAQGPRRLKVAEEWSRAYSELPTSFTGSDITSGTVAKRAGRYVCILFSQTPEGVTILSILNRDGALDSQENLGKDYLVEKVYSQGAALGLVTQNKIVFWKPATPLGEGSSSQPC